jgi:hypothetical protein
MKELVDTTVESAVESVSKVAKSFETGVASLTLVNFMRNQIQN